MGLKKTALIVAVTAIIINWIPSLLKPSLPKVHDGYTAPGWEAVGEVFKSQIESGIEQGAGFAVWYKGKLVVDYVGGYADLESARPWKRNMLSILFSSTKGVSAVAVALLVERKLLAYDEPVVKYWPEFGQNGKEKITVRTLLSHTAGLAWLDENIDMRDIVTDPEKVSRALAKQKPAWTPGTDHGYHALTIAMYMNELIKRVDPKHRTLQQFFKEEIAKPFDINVHIGLPLDQYHRTTHIYDTTFWDLFRIRDSQLAKIMFFHIFSGIISSDWKKVLSSPSGFNLSVILDPDFQAIPLGSASGFASPAGAAKLFGILGNGGVHKGKKLLSMATIKDMMKPMATGPDRLIYLNITYAAGVNIFNHPPGEVIFGTPGTGGQMAVADPQRKLGWAYVTNHMKHATPTNDYRTNKLLEATYKIVKKMERK